MTPELNRVITIEFDANIAFRKQSKHTIESFGIQQLMQLRYSILLWQSSLKKAWTLQVLLNPKHFASGQDPNKASKESYDFNSRFFVGRIDNFANVRTRATD